MEWLHTQTGAIMHCRLLPCSQLLTAGIMEQTSDSTANCMLRCLTCQANQRGQGLVNQRHQQVALQADCHCEGVDSVFYRLHLLYSRTTTLSNAGMPDVSSWGVARQQPPRINYTGC